MVFCNISCEQFLSALFCVTECDLNASVEISKNFDFFFRVKEHQGAVGLVR